MGIPDAKADLNSCFDFYGEVIMKRDTIKKKKKEEIDYNVFDIEMEEDEFEEQRGLSIA